MQPGQEPGHLHTVTGAGQQVGTDSGLPGRKIKVQSQQVSILESGDKNLKHSVESGVPAPAENLSWRVSELLGTLGLSGTKATRV